MAISMSQYHWIDEVVSQVMSMLRDDADANGNFGVFQVGATSADDAQPDEVMVEAERQLRARGVRAFHVGWTLRIEPPYKP